MFGTLLLIFGLQWLRKAILRGSGLKSLHDEEEEFRTQSEAARLAGDEQRYGLDWFSFVVSFKGVFLEGVEVVFIVITFGLNAHNVPLAAAGASAAGVVVLAAGAIAHRPLTRIPENTLKYIVGLLLASFGTFWAVEGLGVFRPSGDSLELAGQRLVDHRAARCLVPALADADAGSARDRPSGGCMRVITGIRPLLVGLPRRRRLEDRGRGRGHARHRGYRRLPDRRSRYLVRARRGRRAARRLRRQPCSRRVAASSPGRLTA